MFIRNFLLGKLAEIDIHLCFQIFFFYELDMRKGMGALYFTRGSNDGFGKRILLFSRKMFTMVMQQQRS